MESAKGKKTVQLYDADGKPYTGKVPNPLTAKFCKSMYHLGQARVGVYDDSGVKGDTIREKLVRAQAPYVVTLLVYESKFQPTPTPREYYIYAPMEIQHAAKAVMRLWQLWERPKREEFTFGDMNDVFPKVDDGIVAVPIDDSTFASHWADVKKRTHRKAGHPEDPFAFTCLDQDVRLFKVADFQEGLDVKIL